MRKLLEHFLDGLADRLLNAFGILNLVAAGTLLERVGRRATPDFVLRFGIRDIDYQRSFSHRPALSASVDARR